MKRVHSYLAVLLAALLLVAGTMLTGALPACTPVQVTGATKLEVSVGTSPAAGWAWLVGVIKTGPEKTDEKLTEHRYAWTFFVVMGSMEISTAEGKKTLSAGDGMVIAAEQQHSHSYLPESEILVIQLRPADQLSHLPGPAGQLSQKALEVHGGRTVSPMGERINLAGGTDYKLRVREFSLSRGQRISDALNIGANFGYIQDGTLTIRKGDNLSTIEAGKTFVLPLDGVDTVSNESATRVRFILVDVH